MSSKGATAGLSSSEGKFSRESTAGQASSGTLWGTRHLLFVGRAILSIRILACAVFRMMPDGLALGPAAEGLERLLTLGEIEIVQRHVTQGLALGGVLEAGRLTDREHRCALESARRREKEGGVEARVSPSGISRAPPGNR